ncbi:hypothetical protein BT96DRAFT_1009823 [Gymnopus androsaceus JB14]|uniref:Reverse transcriptase domain-containing protein n=1 Tax=Gymnopus androsaceus JB14 TaxID=1447944 RepID=A0A6A4GBY4_9AGAR|nr:hypothetical protein BT96DRAFT_1009823 [Gymnopus androsaceus JB14]
MQTVNKDSWPMKQVASILYLDVWAAFPNVSHIRLLDRMRDMGLHKDTVRWVASFLTDSSTLLSFDDFTSDPVPVPTGIPQGSLLSVILYLIYSSSLLSIGEGTLGKKDQILGFIGNTAFVVVGPTIGENIRRLRKLGEEGLEWANDLALLFNIKKYQLVHHPCHSTPDADQLLPLTLAGHTIKPSNSAKYLGVIVNKGLKFKEHAEKASKPQQPSLASQMHPLACPTTTSDASF